MLIGCVFLLYLLVIGFPILKSPKPWIHKWTIFFPHPKNNCLPAQFFYSRLYIQSVRSGYPSFLEEISSFIGHQIGSFIPIINYQPQIISDRPIHVDVGNFMMQCWRNGLFYYMIDICPKALEVHSHNFLLQVLPIWQLYINLGILNNIPTFHQEWMVDLGIHLTSNSRDCTLFF